MKRNFRGINLAFCVNTSSQMAFCFSAMMESIRRFHSALEQDLTLRAVSQLSVVGYDCSIHLLHPFSPISSDLILPDTPAPWEGQLYLRGLYECLTQFAAAHCDSSPDGTALNILILLTNSVFRGIPGSHPALQAIVPSSILRQEQQGRLVFLPLGIDSPEGVPVLNELSGAPKRFLLPIACSELDEFFDKLRRFLSTFLTYAPGKAPNAEIFSQFLPGHPLSYPPAPPLDFDSVVLGWDEVC